MCVLSENIRNSDILYHKELFVDLIQLPCNFLASFSCDAEIRMDSKQGSG